MAEDVIALSERIYEIFNTGDVDRADELLAEDVVDHQAMPGIPPGRAGFKVIVTMFRAAFPDLHFTIEDRFAREDAAVLRFTMTGTHQGDFMGIPPTGRRVEVAGADLIRYADGRAVEHWGYMEEGLMMQQLGVAPARSA